MGDAPLLVVSVVVVVPVVVAPVTAGAGVAVGWAPPRSMGWMGERPAVVLGATEPGTEFGAGVEDAPALLPVLGCATVGELPEPLRRNGFVDGAESGEPVPEFDGVEVEPEPLRRKGFVLVSGAVTGAGPAVDVAGVGLAAGGE